MIKKRKNKKDTTHTHTTPQTKQRETKNNTTKQNHNNQHRTRGLNNKNPFFVYSCCSNSQQPQQGSAAVAPHKVGGKQNRTCRSKTAESIFGILQCASNTVTKSQFQSLL